MEKTFRFFRHFGVLSMLFLFLNIAYSQPCIPPTAIISGSTTICSGGNTNITFFATPNTILTYKVNGGSNQTIAIPLIGTIQLNTGPLLVNTTYSLVSIEYNTPPKCSTSINGSVQVNVTPNASISNPANKNQSLCINTYISPINFTIGGGGTGATTTGLPNGIAGSYNSGNYIISGTPSTAGFFNYTVTTTGTCTQTSQSGTITVNPNATINSPSNKNQTVCINSAVSPITFSVGGSASGATVSGLPPGLSSNFSGGNLTIQGFPTSSGTFTYIVNTTGSCAQTSISGSIKSDIAAAVDAGPDLTICSNNTAVMDAILGGTATSGTWSTNGTGSFNNNSVNAIYTPSSADIANNKVTLTYTTNDPAGPCTAVSDELVLFIQKQTEILKQPLNTELCSASNSQLEIDAIGLGLKYQWFKGSGNGVAISGATSNILKFNNVKPVDQGIYYVIITNTNVCAPVKSDEVIINVEENLIIHSQPKNVLSCQGDTSILNIEATSKLGSLQFQWRKNGKYLNDNATVSGATSSELSITSTSEEDQGEYDVLITNNISPNCHTATSAKATLSLTKIPMVNAGDEISICENGGNENITVGANIQNYASLEWSSNGSGTISNKNSLTNAIYTSGASDIGTVTITLTAYGNSPCSAQTATKKIKITAKPLITELSYPSSSFCKSLNTDQPITLKGSNMYMGGTFSYKIISGGPLMSLSSTTGSVNPAASNPGTYNIIYETPESGGCSKAIATTSITITKIPNADFNYENGSICKTSNNPLPSFPSGGTPGNFSATPVGLNFISNTTGEINLNSSSPGTYTITNTIPAFEGCATVTVQSTVTIDPAGAGGLVSMSINNIEEKSIVLCHDATGGNNPALRLNGHVGNIVRWEYSINAGLLWLPISNTTSTQTYTGIKETRHYRAITKSGNCTETPSAVAIINIIPPDIKPSPVTASPTAVCLGASVTLTSKSGYATGSYITTGNFSDSNPEGWRINGDDKINFPANGNNTRPNIWSLTNDNRFYTSLDGDVLFDSKSGKFAVVSGPNSSTMETPIFNTLGLATAVLNFTEAYRLYSSTAQATIELSLDGGATYSIILRKITGVAHSGNYESFNLNSRSINLADYIGMTNLRIRFKFNGLSGNVWAIDNISLPSKPTNLTTEWVDINTGKVISTSENFTVTPNKPGVNTYAVTSSINGCKGGTTYVDVMAYDYNLADAGPDQMLSCGINSTNLAATLLTAYTREPKLANGSSGIWTVISGQPSSSYSFSNASSPNSVFTAQPGNYMLAWTITKAANSPCQNSQATVKITFSECSGLDFDGVDDFVDLGTGLSSSYSFEAWVRPKISSGTILSKRDAPDAGAGYELILNAGVPIFKWDGGSVTSSKPISINDRWYHLAISIDGPNVKLYVDGIVFGTSSTFNFTNSNSPLLIGANYRASNKTTTNFFKGWIEEVRIWKAALTEKQIRFLMNQRLYNNGTNMGVEIPIPVPDGLSFDKLAGYYQLIASPTNILTGGLTSNLAISGINAKLNNMVGFQENSAPLPYTSRIDDQTWSTKTTWNNFNVVAPPNSKGIDGITPIEWNIVSISHDISSGGKDITVLGLISDDKTLTVADPIVTDPIENNYGQMLRITQYLKLNGIIDLVGESQLLQDQGSIVDNSSIGYVERDQQGTQSSFNYNYWSSPVSTIASSNNSGYTVGNILLDGTLSITPKPITFGNGPAVSDGNRTNPITISTYWLWRFHGASDNYAAWVQIKNNGKLKSGEGFTMKGSSGAAPIEEQQNYVFRGKPHNGDINLTIAPYENYLVGNPYPSAMDAREFLLDNLSSQDVPLGRNNKNIINGALYFWDHFAGKTHNLKGYIGGYAVYNLSGGAPAISNDVRINNNLKAGTKRPGQFIPVGQGFFVNSEDVNDTITVAGGDIVFTNSQRTFAREISPSSIFLRPETESKAQIDTRSKIRIDFNSPLGYQRQILVTADPYTTNAFDMGYDAPLIEYNIEDMYWLIGSDQYLIQGVPSFEKDQVLPFGIRIEKEENFTIKIGELVNLLDSHNIYLKDKLMDIVHNLRKGDYTSTSTPGDIDDRFEIIFYIEHASESPKPTDNLEPELPNEKPGHANYPELTVRYSHESKELLVRNPKQLMISEIHVFDINGKKLQSFERLSNDKEFLLPLKRYSQGVYIIKIFSEEKLIRKKIIDVGK